MPVVGVLMKPASGLCNMHCDYCFYCDESAKRKTSSYGYMTEHTLKNVIKRTLLQSEGGYTLAFQGGEPTLCGLDFFRQAIRYIHQYNKNHCHIQIALQTNGYGITEEWARFFAGNHFLLGVSVDGLKEIHNTYRHAVDGGDSYQHCMNTIRLFEKYGVEYNILTVVHREIAENIRNIYREYKNNGWNYLQFITCLDPLGVPRGQEKYSLLPEMYGRFLVDLFTLWFEDLKRGSQPYIRQFENYIGILLGYEPESCEQRGFCEIQNVVEADGSVYPCDFYVLDEYKLGNLNEDLLPTIHENRRKIGYLERSHHHLEECRTCPYFHLCRGGCYRNRITESHAEGENYFCPGYKLFFQTCGDQLREAAEIYQNRIRRRS